MSTAGKCDTGYRCSREFVVVTGTSPNLYLDRSTAMNEVVSGLMTTMEACRYLRIGKTSFYRHAALKRIRNVRIGRSVRWQKADLDRFIASQTRQRR